MKNYIILFKDFWIGYLGLIICMIKKNSGNMIVLNREKGKNKEKRMIWRIKSIINFVVFFCINLWIRNILI